MKNLMLSLFILLTGSLPAVALADQTGIISTPACNVIIQQNKTLPADKQQSLSGCTTTQKGIGEAGGLISNIIEGIVFVAGILAVIFTIVGGINFIGSTGDPARIARAKNSIQYAVIGLIIAILAQLIVSFVIGKVHA